jgi:hypothetical protein
LPEDDYVAVDNPVRFIGAFADGLDLRKPLGKNIKAACPRMAIRRIFV